MLVFILKFNRAAAFIFIVNVKTAAYIKRLRCACQKSIFRLGGFVQKIVSHCGAVLETSLICWANFNKDFVANKLNLPIERLKLKISNEMSRFYLAIISI